MKIYLFFAKKVGRLSTIFFIWYKDLSLRARIENKFKQSVVGLALGGLVE